MIEGINTINSKSTNFKPRNENKMTNELKQTFQDHCKIEENPPLSPF